MVTAFVLVTQVLTPAEQGLFISFLSLYGLLAVFDFGLTYAVLQCAARFAARDGKRLSGLGRTSRQIAVAFALPGVLLIGLLGYFLVGRAGEGVVWRGPWLSYIALMAIAQILLPLVALHEGAVSARGAWGMRLIQECVAGFCMIVSLAVGAGLWSLVFWAAMRVAVVLIWLVFVVSQYQNFAIDRDRFSLLDWRREVWPFQWKIGLSNAAGFLIFRSLTLIVLAVRGAEDAGRFGLSLTIMTMLIGVTTAWPYSQVSRFGALLANGRSEELLKNFRQTLMGSTGLVVLTASVFCGVQLIALERGWPFADRFGDLPTNAFLMATAVVHHGVACFAVLLRLEQRDPLLPISIGGGIVLIFAVFLAARFGDLADVAATNLFVSMTGIPFVWFLMRRFVSEHGIKRGTANTGCT